MVFQLNGKFPNKATIRYPSRVNVYSPNGVNWCYIYNKPGQCPDSKFTEK